MSVWRVVWTVWVAVWVHHRRHRTRSRIASSQFLIMSVIQFLRAPSRLSSSPFFAFLVLVLARRRSSYPVRSGLYHTHKTLHPRNAYVPCVVSLCEWSANDEAGNVVARLLRSISDLDPTPSHPLSSSHLTNPAARCDAPVCWDSRGCCLALGQAECLGIGALFIRALSVPARCRRRHHCVVRSHIRSFRVDPALQLSRA